MKKLTIKIPGFFDDAYDILTMKRGRQRRDSYHIIILETLQALGDQRPTKDQLQVASRIRRSRFIPVLKMLLETKSVERSGSGTKYQI